MQLLNFFIGKNVSDKYQVQYAKRRITEQFFNLRRVTISEFITIYRI